MHKFKKMDVVHLLGHALVGVVAEVRADGRVRVLSSEDAQSEGPDTDDTDLDDADGSYSSATYDWDWFKPEELEFISTLHNLVEPCDELSGGW